MTRQMMRLLYALALLALPLSGSTAHAADVRTVRQGGMTGILMSGPLEFGDEKKFVAAAIPVDDAIVILDGPGGNLHAGIEIGRAIRLKGFSTVIAGTCASACGLALLGGRQRFISASGRVGFHAASWSTGTGNASITSAGNALVGAYLNQLGMSQSAIVYLTSRTPEEMAWLTLAEARRHGIEVAVLSGSQAASSPTRTPARTDWTGYGEWVQAASRPTLDEAVAVAAVLRQRNANTSVFRYANGWYVVAVGPFSQGRGTIALGALVAAGEVPRDSFVASGDKFDAHAWGAMPVSRGTSGVQAIAR